MKPEQHTLTLRARSTTLAYSPNHDGECSCGKWKMKDKDRGLIRAAHWEHAEKELAPKDKL